MVHEIVTIGTRGQGLYDFSGEVQSFVSENGLGKKGHSKDGLCNVFVRHTSCSLTIQENADPDVQSDLKNFFARLVPPSSDPSMGWVTHTNEGDDDMPAHIKSALTQTNLTIPFLNGRLLLGTWQAIYLFEHRNNPHHRQVVLSVA